MAKKKPAFNLLNIVDESQLQANLETLQKANSKISPTEKEVEIVKTGEGDVKMLPLSALKSYHNHTYQVLDNEDMAVLADSIKDYGILLPLIVRELNGGKYEVISGHRRRFAAEKLGLSEVPCKIMDLDDDMADIVMADTNIARETILPSEKAHTYRVRLEAAVRQGKKTEEELRSMADASPDSVSKIRRYMKLNDLSPALLSRVDDGSIPVTAGIILSDFSNEHQQILSKVLEDRNVSVPLKTAEKLKKAAEKNLTEEIALSIVEGKLTPRSTRKKSSGKAVLTEEMLMDVVPDSIKELPLEDRVDYYKKAIAAYEGAENIS